MAWIQVHQALIAHRKTYTLAGELGICRAQAVGHLAMLWTWALDNAPDGCLPIGLGAAIADVCDWRGAPETFVDALINAGFVDLGEEGLHLHDWEEYAGTLLSRREREAERKRAARGADVGRMSAGCPQDVPPPSGRRVEKSRVENPLPPTGGTVLLEVPPEKVPDRFPEWWLLYPHKGTRSHRGQARSSWDARLAEGVPAAVIIGHTRHMAADEEWQREDGRAVPGAHRYLAKTDFSLPSVLAAAAGAGPEQFRYLDDVEADRG